MLRRVAVVRTDVSEELSASMKMQFFIVTAVKTSNLILFLLMLQNTFPVSELFETG
jgi:hypothetical protein